MKKESDKQFVGPNSVAIIMDGNGRWAKARHLPRSAGHIAGAKRVQPILEELRRRGVHHVTLYAFSTENWKRPKEEVDGIMNLVYKYLDEVVMKMILTDKSFSMKFIGDLSALPEALRNKCIEIEQLARDREFVCNLAINYGGRDEIVNAANMAIRDGHTSLTKDILSKYMYTAASPDPDLVIRTGGDFRVSNFLLWQSAYSEYYVTDTLWPDFDESALDRALDSYGIRERRYGGITEN